MPLNPKYFNRTVILGGVVAALMLAITSVYIHLQSRMKFQEYAQRMQNQIEHTYFHKIFDQDSVRVPDFKGKVTAVLLGNLDRRIQRYVERCQGDLPQHPEKLVVIAASIRRIKPSVKDYMGDRKPELVYVDGTKAYSDFDVPGVPTMIVFKSDGSFPVSKIGYRRKSDLDRLRKLLETN